MSTLKESADKLLEFLYSNEKDRGVMADLRCGFSSAREYRAWPHIAAYCELDNDWSRIPVQTVCAAFATQPHTSNTGNLGTTLRNIAPSTDKEGLASFEGRFRRLLTCETKYELCQRVPQIIRAAKAKEVPVNHYQLYCDICRWEKWNVKIQWAAAYWGQPQAQSQTPPEGGAE